MSVNIILKKGRKRERKLERKRSGRKE